MSKPWGNRKKWYFEHAILWLLQRRGWNNSTCAKKCSLSKSDQFVVFAYLISPIQWGTNNIFDCNSTSTIKSSILHKTLTWWTHRCIVKMMKQYFGMKCNASWCFVENILVHVYSNWNNGTKQLSCVKFYGRYENK